MNEKITWISNQWIYFILKENKTLKTLNIKWSVNKAMDLLNGRPHIFSLFPLTTNLHENILKLYIDEKEYLLVKHGLQNEVMEILKYER